MGLPFSPPIAPSCPFHNGEWTELWMLAGEQQHPAGRKLDNAFVTPRIVCHRREFTLRRAWFTVSGCALTSPRTAPQRACTEIFVGRYHPGFSLPAVILRDSAKTRHREGQRRCLRLSRSSFRELLDYLLIFILKNNSSMIWVGQICKRLDSYKI